MKKILFIILILSSYFNSTAQTDTVSIDYWSYTNDFIFANTNSRINPNYDTIYSKIDSTLYQGYINIHRLDKSNNDTIMEGQSIFKVVDGVGKLLKSKQYAYPHAGSKFDSKYLAFEGFSTDSSFTLIKYYPNGELNSKNTNWFSNESRYSNLQVFDSTGTLTNFVEKKNGNRHGRSYFLLNDSITIAIDFHEGQFNKLIDRKGIFFDQKNKALTEEKFGTILKKDSSLSWGFISLKNTKYDCNIDFAFYLLDDKNNQFIMHEKNGLSEKRYFKLIKRIEKQCTTKNKRH